MEDYLEPRTTPSGSHLVDWHSLTSQLVAATRAQHPEDVSFHWEHGLESSEAIDLSAGTVQLAGPSGQAELRYDLLVGADGTNSRVRNKLLGAGFLSSKVLCLSPPPLSMFPHGNGADHRAPRALQLLYSAAGRESSRYTVVHGLDLREDEKLAAALRLDTPQGPRIQMKRHASGSRP